MRRKTGFRRVGINEKAPEATGFGEVAPTGNNRR